MTSEISTRQVLSLTASAFVVLAAEPLYLLIDTAVVGHLGSVQLAGLGVAGAFLSLLMLIGGFVEYGTTSRGARWYGAGRFADAVNEGVQASWLSAGIGAALVVVGEALAGPVCGLLAGGSGAVAAAAVAWLRIALIGLPGVLLVMAGNGWMRAVQETRSPVRIVLLANGLSAAASPLLVYPLGLGLRGSAIANVLAQAVATALFLRALGRAATGVRPHWPVMRSQLSMGRDLILRQLGFQVAFLTAAAVASRMGTAQIAAHQIGLQLWEFTALLLDSFAIAAQSLVGAALGGADVAVARRTAWQVARFGLYAGVAFAALYGAGWWVVPRIFSSSALVQHQAHLLWPWFVGMMPAAGILFALDGVLIGAGDVAFMRTLTIVAAVFFFAPLNLLALHFGWGIGGVWAGLTSFILVRFVGMVLRTRGTAWAVVGASR